MPRVARTFLALALAFTFVLVVAACSTDDADPRADDAMPATSPSSPVTSTSTSPSSSSPTTTRPAVAPGSAAVAAPGWLGTRVLPETPEGYGEIQPTPPEMVDRRFVTPEHLPPPVDERFASTVEAVPDEVLARSTWQAECPVTADELRHVTVTFWGFDGWVHRGELLVHRDAADAAVGGFRHLFERRFPIEEMRIATPDDLDAPPTGDGNNTGAFVCRPSVGSTSWSQHAYGRAVDINPFHNPYVHDDVVLPELASAYVDRADERPGMLDADDVAGFTSAGWGWGGAWSSLKDYMHVSVNGR